MSKEEIAIKIVEIMAPEIKERCKDKNLHQTFEEFVESYQLILKYLDNDYLNY